MMYASSKSASFRRVNRNWRAESNSQQPRQAVEQSRRAIASNDFRPGRSSCLLKTCAFLAAHFDVGVPLSITLSFGYAAAIDTARKRRPILRVPEARCQERNGRMLARPCPLNRVRRSHSVRQRRLRAVRRCNHVKSFNCCRIPGGQGRIRPRSRFARRISSCQ